MSMRAFSVAILASIALALGSLAACSDDDDGPPDATGGDNFVTGPSGEPTVAVPAPETPAAGGPSAGSASPPGAPAFSEPPSTTATANGQTVNAGIGTFCWTLLCVDKIGVPTEGSLTVTRGDTVTVDIPAGTPPFREAYASVFPAVTPRPLDGGGEIWPYPGSSGVDLPSTAGNGVVEVPVDLEPGRYVLAVSMYFDPGDVVYGFLLEVQ